jgi:hypothetical protein
LKTLDAVINYINSKGYCHKPFDFTTAAKQVVESLKKDEEIIFACATSALVNGAYTFKNGVIAITNERLIYAVKTNSLFAKNLVTKSISLDFVSDITKTVLKAYGFGNIAFDCRNEQFNYVVSLDALDQMYTDINNALDHSHSKNTQGNATISSADELKKFKELLDAGIITQEEFDAKKKQLLGL